MNYLKTEIESEILQGCLRNERFYQHKLYNKYKDAMYTVVYRIMRNEALACDALQEGFVEVFTCLDNFKGNSTLGAWMKTIMIRKAFRLLKKEIQFFDYEEELKDVTIEWDENLTGEVLDKAIAELSPGYRSVFIMIEVEGYNHKEVGDLLGISEGTSKSQLSRAKKILQQKITALMN